MIFDRLLCTKRNFVFAALRTAESKFLFGLLGIDQFLTPLAEEDELRGWDSVLALGNRRDGAKVRGHKMLEVF